MTHFCQHTNTLVRTRLFVHEYHVELLWVDLIHERNLQFRRWRSLAPHHPYSGDGSWRAENAKSMIQIRLLNLDNRW